MAALVQQLASLAQTCFDEKQDTVSEEPFKNVLSAMNTIQAKHLNFDPSTVKVNDSAGGAPVTFIHVYKNDIFSMRIFVIKPSGRIPLHDHPGMFGLCKVIHGSVHLRSFSEVEEQGIQDTCFQSRENHSVLKSVRLHQDMIVTSSDDCCFLTPREGNFHEILPVQGMAAFLDVLAPPYNPGRDCHYYDELGNDVSASDAADESVRWLRQVPTASDYWCDRLVYKGPSIEC
ncbi:2-aminoethanethiol dioxygenase-like [Haliotis rufescens]|uniref:2-aminoethanethiol dioxygenase-like n=1 Tax=Haliotis rufescens TaxID=6454 RepID=UPI00201EADFB|nr:2-aminoethanethiol dioxygenase-like [Haliotis rufescens]